MKLLSFFIPPVLIYQLFIFYSVTNDARARVAQLDERRLSRAPIPSFIFVFPNQANTFSIPSGSVNGYQACLGSIKR